MSFPLYHEDLCQLFERADCQYIFGRREKTDVSLNELEVSNLGLKQSIKAMKSIVEALLYLRLNLVMPCQLRFNYVIRRKEQWGLSHAICERSEEIDGQTQDSYNPEQFLYHQNAEDELVWNMGQIWLRFFTAQPIRIREMNQNKINQVIDSGVENASVNSLLKRVLTRDRHNRMSFQQFVSGQSLIPEEAEKSKYFSSVIMHLRTLSYIMKTSKARMNKLLSRNPYLQELRYRHFMEYLDIDVFLQNIKSDIRKAYYNEDEKQKASCQFTFYIITLQDYANMVKLNTERLDMNEHFEGIEHRIYYSRFTERMLKIKDILYRKAKVLKNNAHLTPGLTKFLEDPDKIDPSLVYEQFKTLIIEYVEYLSEDLNVNKNDIGALRLMTKLYIARTSSYIFAEYRREVFAPFLQADQDFSIKKILGKINECKSLEPLRALLVNIKEFYFKK